MKLIRFHIGDYLVLRDLKIDFGDLTPRSHLTEQPRQYAIDFLVGVNGTGKSTVLRLLGAIFKALESSTLDDIKTGFLLEYLLRSEGDSAENRIIIEHQKDPESGVWQTQFMRNSEPLDAFDENLLPHRVVVLTTGSEDHWLSLQTDRDRRNTQDQTALGLSVAERYQAELPGFLPRPEAQEETPAAQLRRLIFMRQRHLPLVTLCGLISNYGVTEKRKQPLYHILEETNIRSLAGFSLRCRLYEELSSDSARQTVAALRSLATRTVRQGPDLLLVFLNKTDNPSSMVGQILQHESLGRGLALFEQLYPLTEPDEFGNQVLQDVDIFLQLYLPLAKPGQDNATDNVDPAVKPPLHLLKWFSDGEQTFLGRMALLSILDRANTLALLDEPEVHFNDYWKRRIVKLLNSVMREHEVHALITTHSSIALTDVSKDDVIRLERDGVYTSNTPPVPIQTFGADPSDIIVHVFNAPHATGQYSVDEILDLLRQSEEAQNARARQQEIEKLTGKMEGIAPGYFRFRVREQIHRLSNLM